jgi:thioredoxin 1
MLIRLLRQVRTMLGILLVISTAVFAQQKSDDKSTSADQGIVFRSGTWDEVVAEAQRSGKFIFVDAYATWCRPCKLLQSTTFREKNAAVYFNKNFINYTADMERGEGIQLGEKWEVTSYPALLFFDAEGKVVMRHTGYVDGRTLIKIGRQALLSKR